MFGSAFLGAHLMRGAAAAALLAWAIVHQTTHHCLALGGVDLTSAAGKMTMGVPNAVAEFARDLLIERTQAGLSRARAEGKTLAAISQTG